MSQKHEDGSSARHLLIFVSLVKQLGIPFLILENVPQFKEALIAELFADMCNITLTTINMTITSACLCLLPLRCLAFLIQYVELICPSPRYVWQTTVLCNTTFGQASTRRRRYTTLSLRGYSMALSRPLADLNTQLQRSRADTFTYLDHCTATPHELQLELQWASQRKASVAKDHGYSSARPLTCDAVEHPFELALCRHEHKHLARFRERAPPNRVIALNLQ